MKHSELVVGTEYAVKNRSWGTPVRGRFVGRQTRKVPNTNRYIGRTTGTLDAPRLVFDDLENGGEILLDTARYITLTWEQHVANEAYLKAAAEERARNATANRKSWQTVCDELNLTRPSSYASTQNALTFSLVEMQAVVKRVQALEVRAGLREPTLVPLSEITRQQREAPFFHD